MDGKRIMELVKSIQELVQQCIDGQEKYEQILIIKERCNDEVEKYRCNTALRFVKNWGKYKKNQISQFDMLISLRNYLLLFQTSVRSEEIINMLENNPFGLMKDIDETIYCSLMTPSYLNEKITEQAFMRVKSGKKVEKPYFLGTNSYLQSLTGFHSFKTIEQKIAVMGALKTPSGYTSLIALPTGGGKSLITQSIGYQSKDGLTIVVVPTVSLAIDQVRAAKKNIKHNTEEEIFCYYSGLDQEDKKKVFANIQNKKARLLFISPEALIKNKVFHEIINDANKTKYLKNIVIDEAHIVIEWGSFFRIDYQCLEPWRYALMEYNSSLRTFLLSATFEKDTVYNLKRMFSDQDKWIEIRCDSLRKEPRFQLVNSKSYGEKMKRIRELLCYLPRPMVLYVTSPEQALKLKKLVNDVGFTNVELFTGLTKSHDRERIIKQWAEDELDLMIATSAFGVGVDKSDVRTVLHLYVPETPNAYYQELGRGGRDGLPCLSVMCIEAEGDLNRTFNKVGKVLGSEKIIGRWKTMLNSPTSKRYMNTYSLDTSLKPQYNTTDELLEEVSQKDIQWNIYVILLLRRYELIRIVDIVNDPKTQQYFIRVEIIDELLLSGDNQLIAKITSIRESEWRRTELSFKTMKRAIQNVNKMCWSEMFFETYNNVSEYCSGCNNHERVINMEPKRFPLVKKIDQPVSTVDVQIQELVKNSKEVLVIAKENKIKIISELIRKGIDFLVVDDDEKNELISSLEAVNSYSRVNIIGFNEFSMLEKNKAYYYITGAAVAIHDCREKDLYTHIVQLKKAEEKCGVKVIHLIDKDIYIDREKKMLSAIIDGTKLESYLLERML